MTLNDLSLVLFWRVEYFPEAEVFRLSVLGRLQETQRDRRPVYRGGAALPLLYPEGNVIIASTVQNLDSMHDIRA